MDFQSPQLPDQPSAVYSQNVEDIIECQIHVPAVEANFFSIYQYATKLQLCGLFLSACCAIAAGAAMPVVTIFFGSLTNEFVQALRNEANSTLDIAGSVRHLTLKLVYTAIGSFVMRMLSTWGFNHIGDRITSHLRQIYLSAVLQQNAAYFDVVGRGELLSHMDTDMKLIQDGLSQKLGLIFAGFSGFVVAIIVTFTQSWYFALIMLCQPVALILVIGGLGIWLKQIHGNCLAQYVRVDNLAQEVFSAMRNIIAYRSQTRFGKKYHRLLLYPTALETRERLVFGLMVASSFTVLHWANGIGFWQADRIFHRGTCTIAEALTILYASSVAGAELGQALPFLVSVAQASNAAKRIFSVIQRASPINALSNTGRTYSSVQGHIEFKNLRFAYPSRADHLIMNGVDLIVPAGKTVALVGPSGSGKSTIFALLERLYLQTSGQILLDHEPIEELNLAWFRSQLGYVSQDVVLFHASIHENIAYGLSASTGEHLNFSAIRDLVIRAAQTAQIHSFIIGLPDDYDTVLGLQGSLLSGGQKQMIAIARAIVSEPPILLLDEATAALDSQSEKEVQEALDAAAEGRTTLVIAHRLSTVQNADQIVVMENGRVLEQGTHSELIAQHTLYSELVRQQALRSEPSSERNWAFQKDLEGQPLSSLETVSGNFEDGILQTTIDTSPAKKDPIWSFSRCRSLRYVWRLGKPEWPYILGSLVCSILGGISYPIHAIYFGNGIISIISPRLSTTGHTTRFWALIYLIHGIIVFVIYCARGYFLSVSASRLNLRARSSLFKALLHKDISFFGRTEHSIGYLTGFLSSGVSKIVGVSASSLSLVLESLAMLITGIAIGWAYGWELGGIATATIPLIVLSGYLQYYLIEKVQEYIQRDSTAVAVAHEGLSAMKTVAVLGLETTMMKKFDTASSRNHKGWHWVRFSLAYACTSSLSILSIAFVFWYGGTRLIATHDYTIQEFYICFVAVVGGSQAAAAMFAHAPDIAGAHHAVEELKELMRHSLSQSLTQDQKEASAPSSVEDLIMNRVNFRYPSQHTLTLKDVSFQAPAGRFIALVGATGSGKSSVINLVERFFKPDSGKIVLGDETIDTYEAESFHRYLALVDQNTCLVGEDLRECLQSGDEDVSDEDILAVLKSVSLEDFISSLPSGLNTPVAGNGSNLSGGQRQRMAITKALLWKPKILLLDEATSALDSASERAVQDALRNATTTQTTIAVAHRLKTIAHAAEILVFDRGCIVERGTHDELLLAKGQYWELARLQDLGSE